MADGPIEWVIQVEPEKYGEVAGLTIYVTDGNHFRRHEVGRVAFTRSNSINPDVSFEDQLDAVMARAEKVRDLINDTLDDLDRARAAAVEKVADEVRDMLAEVPQGKVQ